LNGSNKKNENIIEIIQIIIIEIIDNPKRFFENSFDFFIDNKNENNDNEIQKIQISLLNNESLPTIINIQAIIHKTRENIGFIIILNNEYFII
jgi:hypothetical protein